MAPQAKPGELRVGLADKGIVVDKIAEGVAIDIESASAKIRIGPAKDDEEDYALTMWAGVLPMQIQHGEPLADDRLPKGTAIPEYIKNYKRLQGRTNQH